MGGTYTGGGSLQRTLPEGHYVAAVAECRLARSLIAQRRSDEAASHFSRSLDPLIATDQVPDYRAECLTAAAEYYQVRGDTEQAGELRIALESRQTP